MLHFGLLEKGLEIASPTYYKYDFSRKMIPMLFSINLPNLNA